MRSKAVISLVVIMALPLVLLCAVGRPANAQTPVGAVEHEPATSEESGNLDEAIATQTREPTATPGFVTEGVSNIAQQTGLADVAILGLFAEDWINLGISLLIILFGYLIGTWVIRRWLPKLVRRTSTDYDDKLVEAIGPDVRWLVVILFIQFAIGRLVFVKAELKTPLQSLFFVVAIVIASHLVWQLINISEEWLNQKAVKAERDEELAPVIKLLVILSRVFAVVAGIAVLLSHFGFNISVFVASLGIGGLALSLAARDIIADILAGITILTDQPFRIGDRIEIHAIGTWGDVVDIGLRTTRVRTRDNRMVIVPNSSIAKNEVINYTYPDPRYRIQTHVSVAYGTNVETARQVIIDSVRQLEEVLSDKPVDALYNEMGDSAMIFLVRWWIESYSDTRQVIDRVHTSIQAAFDASRIVIPFPTGNLNLQLEPGTVGQLSQALKNPNEK